MNRFAKTILTLYCALPLMIKKIDSTVYNRAVKSHCIDRQRQNTLEQMRLIISLIDKKRQLEELRYVTDKTMEKLDKKAKKLLKLRYFDRLSVQKVREQTGMSERTFFRQMSAALNSFASALTLDGFDRDWFVEIYLKQSWIKNIYNKID